jgi:hypothetical protein
MGTRRSTPKPGDPGGRPSDIDTIVTYNPDGTPVTTAQAIIQSIREGEFLETAAPRHGVALRTARSWLQTAGKTRIRILGHTGRGQPRTTAYERECLTFSSGYEQATAEYEGVTLREIDDIARGGRRIASVRTKRRFVPGGDPDGIVVERIEETRTVPPDGDLLRWRLQMRVPGRYSPKLDVRLTDPDDTLTDDEVAGELADALEAFLAGREEGLREASEPKKTKAGKR